MSEPPASRNDDRTDELPALEATLAMRHVLAAAVPDSSWGEDTAEHRLAVGQPRSEAAVSDATPHPLSAEVERWSTRCMAAERALADQTLLIADLDGAMAAARKSYETLKRDAERLAAELAERSRSLTAAQEEAARLRAELATIAKPAIAAADPASAAAESQRLHEDYAVLAAYVDQRRAWWERAQAEIAALATKAAALEHELTARDRRVVQAEAHAAREVERASEWRAQAIAYAREARELRRSAPGAPRSLGEDSAAGAGAQRPQIRAELDRVERALAGEAAARAALERALADKDREIAAREERLASLQHELDERRAIVAMPAAPDRSPPKARAAGRVGTPAMRSGAPALLCLSGDAPHRLLLGQTTTFGRGAHCDVQILTHYVSREHARIAVTSEGVTIEDLGSRNGVYVNAVRVSRQQLRPGDSIKIGETQFRFIESVAH